jgi:hypothetical protein
MASRSVTYVHSGMKKDKYNAVCVENEDSVIALLNEELDIDPDVQLDLEIVAETASEEVTEKMPKGGSESEISVVRVDGWEAGDKKPKAY